VPMTSSFDYAVVRVVPRVERGEFINAGVILFCRELRFLEARVMLDEERLGFFAPWVDTAEVQGHLAVIPLVTSGSPEAGPIGRLDLAGRFHWLVAPRSTIIQTSPVHSGLCTDPAIMLDRIFETLVAIRMPLDESLH
jgi:hypothetical protein